MRDDIRYQQGKIVICHLCDKQVVYPDDVIIGKQSGTVLHMSCYHTCLKEKTRGNET